MTQAAGNMLARVFLDQLTNRIRTIIDDAHHAGRDLEMEAGRQVALAIDNARAAYSESLDETVQKVDQVFRSRLDQLEGMVQRALDHNAQTLRTLTQDAQIFINTIPFANLFPQVKKVTPKLVAPQAGGEETICVVEGNFATASQKGLTPTFSLNGHWGRLVGNTTQELQFSIPRSAFLFPTDRPEANYGEINFPKESVSPWSKAPFSFRVMIGSVLSTAGKITLHWQGDKPFIDRRWRSERKIHQASPHTRTYQLVATTGWKLDPGTEVYDGVWTGVNGAYVRNRTHNITMSRANDTTVTCEVLSRQVDLHFDMSFQESKKSVSKGSPESKEVSVKWGETLDKELPLDWNPVVVFTTTEGRTEDTSSSSLNGRYITVVRQGDNLSIKVKSPEEIQ